MNNPEQQSTESAVEYLREIDWKALAAKGSIDELFAWGDDAYHVDLSDEEVVLSLAANAIMVGAWRNNSELEDIHVGAHKKRGQSKSGLSDAEMMLGNIGVAKTVKEHLIFWDEYWDQHLFLELLDSERPYAAGITLGAHVSKVGLKKHSLRVESNLYRFAMVAELIGRDRFLRGLALVALDGHPFWGSPMWPYQVDSWVDGEHLRNLDDPVSIDPRRVTPDVVARMKKDPTNLPLDVIEYAVEETVIGYANGIRRWHATHCGDPAHRSDDPDLKEFLGFVTSLMGIPTPWLVAYTANLMQ